jgi:hypothetical protein
MKPRGTDETPVNQDVRAHIPVLISDLACISAFPKQAFDRGLATSSYPSSLRRGKAVFRFVGRD